MRYRLTISAVLGLAGSGVTTLMWAQTQSPPEVRLVGRVFDEAHRLVEGVEVIVHRREASGFALDEEPEIEMLSRVNPSDIEMIEVFRGAGQIPGVFHWNGCAVVAIWTRWNR